MGWDWRSSRNSSRECHRVRVLATLALEDEAQAQAEHAFRVEALQSGRLPELRSQAELSIASAQPTVAPSTRAPLLRVYAVRMGPLPVPAQLARQTRAVCR